MLNKKNNKVDLEKKRGMFFQIGFIVSCIAVLIVFEWGVPLKEEAGLYRVDDIELDADYVRIVREKEIKPPMPRHYSKIFLIPDDEEPGEDFILPNPEIDPDEAIVLPVFERQPENEEPQVMFMSQVMPEFPGGKIGLQKYIAHSVNSKIINEEVQGKVFVRFIINEKGNVEQASVIRSVHPLLDKEALRVVNSLPPWKPGSQNGRHVKVWYTLPIVFQVRK